MACEVEDALKSLDQDDLKSHSGRHSLGYTDPSEAAEELLQEAMDPYLEDMKRRMELGLEAEALEICKGILLSLYSVRDQKTDSGVEWAPNFLDQTAADTALAWCADGAKKGPVHRERALFLQEFAKEDTPEWEALILRVLSRTG